MDTIDRLPTPTTTRRRTGRPRKGEGPRINYEKLDEVLVFGEPGESGGLTVHYPTYRELAARYGVAVSVIGEYARRHKCQKRRKGAAARIRARADEKQIDLHAQARRTGAPVEAPATTAVLQAAREEVLDESGTRASSTVPNAP